MLILKISNILFEGMRKLVIHNKIERNYIVGHHKKPLSEINDKTKTEIKDILLVCDNCYGMFHVRIPCYSEDEIREFINIAMKKR